MLYSIQNALYTNQIKKPLKKPKHRVASTNEREQLKTYFNQLIEEVDYHQEKQHVASKAFSNILSRGYVSGREVTTLMGVFKWIHYQLKNPSSEKTEE